MNFYFNESAKELSPVEIGEEIIGCFRLSSQLLAQLTLIDYIEKNHSIDKAEGQRLLDILCRGRDIDFNAETAFDPMDCMHQRRVL